MLRISIIKAGIIDNDFLNNYVSQDTHKLLSYLNSRADGKPFIVYSKLSGTDFILSFDLIMLAKRNLLDSYRQIEPYALKLTSIDNFQRVMRLAANHDRNNPN